MSRCVFISYSSKDIKVAREIENWLRAERFEIWRDQRHIETDWSAEIAYALTDRADVLCLLWSRAAARSKWVRNEWLTARAIEKLIVPWVLPGAPSLPPPLVNMQWVPHADRPRLLRMLRASPPRYDFRIRPPNVHIPFNPSPNFEGRKRDLSELYRQLIGNLNKIGINQVGVVGMGGIGKTQLAIEFVYRFSFAFDAIFWVDAAESRNWLPQIVEIARDRLKLKRRKVGGIEVTRQYVLALQNYFSKHRRTLIVMDNVRDPKLLNSEGPLFGTAVLSLGCDLLFTTRSHFHLEGVGQYGIDILSSEAASTLLENMRPQPNAAERKSAGLICRAVGNLPLALVLIGSYLRNMTGVSYAEYYQGLQQRGLPAMELEKVAPEELASRHQGAVSDVLREQLALVANESAVLLFKLAGHFPENATIPKSRLGLLAGVENASQFERPLDAAFLLLEQLSLAKPAESGSAVQLHPLVKDFAWRLVADTDRGAFLAAAGQRLTSAYAAPARIEKEYTARGIDSVLEDLQVASGWLESGMADSVEITRLARVLDRERHNLALGASLPQQVHFRAHEAGLLELADRCSKCDPGVFFKSVWTSAGEDPALIRTFRGHSSMVETVNFSATGKYAISGSLDRSLLLWDVATGKSIRSFNGHADLVTSVAFAQDGKRVLSGSADKTVVLWGIDRTDPIHRFEGHTAGVSAVCFHPDGKWALSASADGTLALWCLETGRRLRVFQVHSSAVTSLVFLNRQYFIIGSTDKTVKLWDLDSDKPVRSFDGHSESVLAVCSHPSGRSFLSASGDKTLILWNIDQYEPIRHFIGHHDAVSGVTFLPDGSRVVSASYDRTLIMWDVESGRPVRRYLGHSDWVWAVAVSPGGEYALSACADETLSLWDLTIDTEAPIPRGHTDCVNECTISPDGGFALSASSDGNIVVWDCETGHDAHFSDGHSGSVNVVALLPDGQRAISGSADNTVILWDLKTRQPILSSEKLTDGVEAVAIYPDGHRALVAFWNQLVLWDIEAAKPLRYFKGHDYGIKAVALDPNGRIALSGGGGPQLILWDLDAEIPVRYLEGHSGCIEHICFSADGSHALSASQDGTLIVWEVSVGGSLRKQQALTGHRATVTAAGFARQGNYVISGSEDKSIICWDLNSGNALARVYVPSAVRCLAVSGSRIIYGNERSSVGCLELTM